MPLDILDDRVPMLSPSQVEAATCELHWFFRYAQGLEQAQKSSSTAGTEIDALVAECIRTGAPPTSDGWGPVVLTALHHLQTPGAQVQVILTEVPFAGALWGGRTEGRQMAIDVLDETSTVPFVKDLKTTGDKTRKYVKSKETLATDLQLLVYGRAVSLRFEARNGYLPPRVDFEWVYVLRDKKSPKAWPVSLSLTQEEISNGEKLWNDKVARVMELHRTKASLRMESMTKNLMHCRSFGGCSFGPKFSGQCPLTPKEMYIMSLSQEEIQALLAKQGLAIPSAPVAATPPPAASVPAAAPDPIAVMQAQLAAMIVAQQVTQAPAEPLPTPQMTLLTSPPPVSVDVLPPTPPPPAVAPPAAPVVAHVPTVSIPVGVDPAVFAQWAAANGLVVNASAPAPVVPASAPASTPMAEPAKRPRGRPRKDASVPKSDEDYSDLSSALRVIGKLLMDAADAID